MKRQVDGVASNELFQYSLDFVENLAAMHVDNCPILDIPEWLVMYGLAAQEILDRLQTGEYDLPPNDMLKLRQRIFHRQKELERVGAQHGFFLKSARWFK